MQVKHDYSSFIVFCNEIQSKLYRTIEELRLYFREELFSKSVTLERAWHSLYTMPMRVERMVLYNMFVNSIIKIEDPDTSFYTDDFPNLLNRFNQILGLCIFNPRLPEHFRFLIPSVAICQAFEPGYLDDHPSLEMVFYDPDTMQVRTYLLVMNISGDDNPPDNNDNDNDTDIDSDNDSYNDNEEDLDSKMPPLAIGPQKIVRLKEDNCVRCEQNVTCVEIEKWYLTTKGRWMRRVRWDEERFTTVYPSNRQPKLAPEEKRRIRNFKRLGVCEMTGEVLAGRSADVSVGYSGK